MAAHLIEDETAIDAAWLDAVAAVGITSGASAPERLVRRVVAWFRERGAETVEAAPHELEDVSFRLPREVRREAVPAQSRAS